MEYFKHLFTNISNFVRAMSPSQAIMLIGITAGIVVGAVVMTGWVSSISYATLYSGLEPSEAGEITEYLTEQNIPYQLADGGKTVSVPSGDVYKVRISLASQGLPRSGNIGYSIFDQSNLGMTEFLQNLNFRRALEGELMRTIMQLSDVQAARVHIVMPKDRLFARDQKEATASIVLKLKTPAGLSKSQLAGITHLVAASVEGLKPENISIVDYNGNLLTNVNDPDPLAGLTTSQLEVRKNVENYLEKKAQSMLDGVIGTGKSIVRVTAELDFKQVETTSELYDPNSTVIRSEEKTEETKTVADKSEEVNESTDDSRIETSITNYEINKTVEHIINSVGNVKRLSVALLIDGVYTPAEGAGGTGTTELVYQPRPQEDIDRIASIVKNAVGFDGERNDQIEVMNIAFDNTSMQFEQDKLDQIYQQEFYYDIARKLGIVVLVILAFLYLRKKAKKFFTSLGQIVPVASGTRTVSGSGAGETSERVVPIVEPEKRKPRLLDQMHTVVKDRPEELAKVIKTMMIDEV